MTYAVNEPISTYCKPFAVGRYSPAVCKNYHATRHYGGEAVSFVPKEEGLPVVVAFHGMPKGGIGIGRKESPFGRSFRRAHGLCKGLIKEHGPDKIIFTGVGYGGYMAKTMGELHDVSHLYYGGGGEYGGSFGSFFRKIGRGITKASKKVGKGLKKASKVISVVADPFKEELEKIPVVGTAIRAADKVGLNPLDPYASVETVVNTGKSILK